MFFRKKIAEKLKEIEILCINCAKNTSGRNDIINLLKEENKELRVQLKEVMDRFMSKSFEEHQIFSQTTSLENFEELDPLSSVELAGEIIEGEENSQE